MGHWKTWASNLGLALGSLVLGFAIGEIGLRLANIQGAKKLPETQSCSFFSLFFYPIRSRSRLVESAGGKGMVAL